MENEVKTGRIEQVEIDRQMRSAYIDYSMSVIVSRALPDVRDGLKPVQRRVLFGMDKLNLDYSAATVKSAAIVGEVMGKYHPHGDASIYDTMVRMAQDWNLRYPLVKGQGNFGSMDGYSAAASRYTEAKLEKISAAVMDEIDKDTVDMVKNYDERFDEPTVLPTKVPLLLVNGSAGIAVGMATNMAPHNLGEVCDAVCAYIDNKDITLEELMEHVKGPDFPTGGIIQGISGIKEAYETGRGRVVIRAKTNIETDEHGRDTIVVTEVPYMVNKKEMLMHIAEMVEAKKIEGITYMNDETSRNGVRIIFRVKQGFNANVVLNNLFKYTPLQSSFSINNVALVGGRPYTLNLKDLIGNFVKHRHEVVVRRTKFEKAKAEAEAHILKGLLIAQDNIDRVIEIIKKADSTEDAKLKLQSEFGLDEIQSNAIVEMRLKALTGLEREKLQAKYDELCKFIARCEEILGSEAIQFQIIKDETMEVKEKYGDERRTVIEPAEGEWNPEDFYADDDVVITISHLGYIKRTPLTEFKTQHRGGVGLKASQTRDEDFIEHIYIANMHSTMLLFTKLGRCYWLKVYEIPEGNRTSKGRAIQNVLQIDPEDAVQTYINVPTLKDEEYINSHYVVLVTKRGIIKKTTLEAYSRPRANGINAVTIKEGDALLQADLTNGDSEIMMAARDGRCVRFSEAGVRPMGRNAAGVKGINISETDEVIGVICLDPHAEDKDKRTILAVSENGFGKRSQEDDYRITSRGAKGVKTLNITDKTGNLVAIKVVRDDEDLMIINRSGLTIRMSVDSIRVAGRATQGVKLISIRETDAIAAVSVVPKQDEEEAPATQEGTEVAETTQAPEEGQTNE
ncbi:MAG: DNA gyrase subunit A [Bacteroidales bacterium]|nr:DNA gyrase subunit A [Bacteroidales bacterium]